MRRTIILAAALTIIVLGLWGTAVIYFDQARLRSIVSDRLSHQLGRRVEIAGSVDFNFFPNPGLALENVLIAASEARDGAAELSAARISMTLRVLPLLRGELAPGRMSLDGAVIDLSRSESDGSAGGASLAAAASVLGGRSLQLRDVTVRLPGDAGEAVNEIQIDAIDLDRFSLDRTVSLRFRGDLGRPPILADARLSAQLYVPSASSDAVRLRDMTLSAQLPALGQPLSLVGDLSVRRRPATRLSLSGGRVEVGNSAFDVSFDYRGGERAALDVLASGTRFPALLFPAFGAYIGSSEFGADLASLSRRVDIRAQLQVDRLYLEPLEFADLRVDLRSQAPGVGLDLVAAFPGGLAEASGVLTGQAPERLTVDLSFAEVAELFSGYSEPAPLGGTGQAQAQLTWPSGDGAAFSLDGSGQLWDGFWRVAIGSEAARSQDFDKLDAEFRLTPGYLAVPQFRLTGGDLAGSGWAAADLPLGQLGGEFNFSAAESASLDISGSFGAPQLSEEASSESDSVPADENSQEDSDS